MGFFTVLKVPQIFELGVKFGLDRNTDNHTVTTRLQSEFDLF